MADVQTLIYGFAAGRIAFGLGLLAAPAQIGSSWLGPEGEGSAAQVALRGLGARDIALAAGSAVATAQGRDPRPWLAGCLACDLADLGATLAAGDRIPARGRWGTVALVGVVAAAGAALIAAVDE